MSTWQSSSYVTPVSHKNPVARKFIGRYRISTSTGTMAAGIAAGSAIFSGRWASTTKIALIEEVVIDELAALGTAFATAGSVTVQLTTCTGFTAADSGGSSLTGSAVVAYLDPSYSNSVFTDLRVATTAALTAGTRTVTANVAQVAGYSAGGANEKLFVGRTMHDWNRLGPIVLRADAGFLLRATVEATGVWGAKISVGWSEWDL